MIKTYILGKLHNIEKSAKWHAEVLLILVFGFRNVRCIIIPMEFNVALYLNEQWLLMENKSGALCLTCGKPINIWSVKIRK